MENEIENSPEDIKLAVELAADYTNLINKYANSHFQAGKFMLALFTMVIDTIDQGFSNQKLADQFIKHGVELTRKNNE